MIFLFHKGTVGEDLSDSDLLQLPGHHFEIADERLTPSSVPVAVPVARSTTSKERRSSSNVSS
jgi:hypothetical protein